MTQVNNRLIPPGPYRIMGTMETGEVARYCDHDFQSYEEALDWIDRNADQYPESRLFIEPAVFWNM